MNPAVLYALAAVLYGAAAVVGQACVEGSAEQIKGNWYCSEVKAITYSNFPGTGSYDKITNMDAATGQCSSEKHSYSGSLAPMSEELSMHFRGPTTLKQLAVYYPQGSSHGKRNALGKSNSHRHGHRHFHEKRDSPIAERAVGDMVVATIDGQVVSWINQYAGPGAEPNTAAAPPPPVQTTLSTSVGSPKQPPSTSVPEPPADAGSQKKESDSDHGDAHGGSGSWSRKAYYNADTGSSDGFTFLNHFGGSQGMPGTTDGGAAFGASLSYASSDGKSAASSPQTLANKMIEDNVEVIVMSDKSCDDGGCGYTRPGGVAYHGFGGDHKLFLMEFSMPKTGKTGFNADMPAIWMLNAQIPLTSQYGTNPDCSCWTSGCGEFDLFETLDSGNFRCKSTLHMAPAGGSSDYFKRPEASTIKAAVLLSGSHHSAHIRILDNSQKFDESLAESVIEAIGKNDDDSTASSVFRLAN
ncbi:MAG: hypothetical protein Q9174_002296 [Haloplaca sp. 1 TL-2023]